MNESSTNAYSYGERRLCVPKGVYRYTGDCGTVKGRARRFHPRTSKSYCTRAGKYNSSRVWRATETPRIVDALAARQDDPGQCRRSKGPAQSDTGLSATQVASSHDLQLFRAVVRRLPVQEK